MKGHKAHHHGKHKASGGRTHMWVSGNPDVEKEAEGKESYDKGDEKKKGGAVHKKAKHVGHVEGSAKKHRMDRPRPGRKRGGAVGADRSPLSSAHKGHADGKEMPSSKDSYGGTPSD